jgi:hypothetical protein
MHFFSSLAQGLHFLPHSFVQPASGPHAVAPSQQSRLQPGSGAQKSSHFTTQQVFVTSFISHTTRQCFSHGQQQPQWAQQPGLPHVCTSVQAAGCLHASPATAAPATNQATAKDSTNILILHFLKNAQTTDTNRY